MPKKKPPKLHFSVRLLVLDANTLNKDTYTSAAAEMRSAQRGWRLLKPLLARGNLSRVSTLLESTTRHLPD